MEIKKISKAELTEAMAQHKRHRGKYDEVENALRSLAPGESLKLSCADVAEAKNLRGALAGRFSKSQATPMSNGNLACYKAIRIESDVYLYSTRVEVNK